MYFLQFYLRDLYCSYFVDMTKESSKIDVFSVNDDESNLSKTMPVVSQQWLNACFYF